MFRIFVPSISEPLAMRLSTSLLLLGSFSLFTTGEVVAQQKFTLSDAILKAGTDFAPERVRGLQWIPSTTNYCFVADNVLMRGGLGKMANVPVVGVNELNGIVQPTEPLKRLPAVTWTSANLFYFDLDSVTYQYDVSKNVAVAHITLPGSAEHQDFTPIYDRVAYTIDNDLYVSSAGAKPVRVTRDGADGIVNGKSVHREEYGITKGTFWSPNGNMLAFYRMDETMVTTYQLEDISTKPSTFDKIRYPMAGQTSHHVTVGVFDTKSGRSVFLKTGEPLDQYFTNIAWEPGEEFLQVVHLDRKTENVRVVRYNTRTGEATGTLIEEHSDKFLEPLHPARFMKTRPNEYLWWSERDGFRHLYLYDLKKGLVRQLTKGTWVVTDIVGTDPKESYVIVEGTAPIQPGRPSGALETHLYRVELGSGKTTRLTTEGGSHHGGLSTDGGYLIDTYSSMSVPNRTVIRDIKSGQVMKTLVDSKDPLSAATVGTIELLTIPGENGDFLNARLIKPKRFDPKRKYPVLIYVYNGPHVQLVSNSFLGGASLWMLEAAERGYLVWTVDGHGTDNRGRDFEQAIHRHLGETEVKDQMRGVDYLKSLPFVDGSRIAVHGWSFGGHMTTAMLARNPGVFKVGVAGGPVMDWSMYEVMYTERYMDTPAENPEGYASTTLPTLASKLQDDLLIITGGRDNTVLPEHSLSFLKACIGAGVQVDFFEYPGHEHNVRGKDRLHLMTKVLDYIDQRIVPEP